MTTTDYVIELSESSRSGFAQIDFANQSFEQKVFTSVFGSSGSICMDGLGLFLQNTDLPSILFSPQAYRQIGAPTSGEVIELSLRVCGVSSTTTEKEGALLLSHLDENQIATLEKLDQAFYSTGEVIDDLLFDFTVQHQDVFGTPPLDIERLA